MSEGSRKETVSILVYKERDCSDWLVRPPFQQIILGAERSIFTRAAP